MCACTEPAKSSLRVILYHFNFQHVTASTKKHHAFRNNSCPSFYLEIPLFRKMVSLLHFIRGWHILYEKCYCLKQLLFFTCYTEVSWYKSWSTRLRYITRNSVRGMCREANKARSTLIRPQHTYQVHYFLHCMRVDRYFNWFSVKNTDV